MYSVRYAPAVHVSLRDILFSRISLLPHGAQQAQCNKHELRQNLVMPTQVGIQNGRGDSKQAGFRLCGNDGGQARAGSAAQTCRTDRLLREQQENSLPCANRPACLASIVKFSDISAALGQTPCTNTPADRTNVEAPATAQLSFGRISISNSCCSGLALPKGRQVKLSF